VVVAFCMGTDSKAILASPSGQTLIFYNSLGKNGALALWPTVIVLHFMMGTSIMTVASRQSFAFSRDGALPFSSPHLHMPVNYVWFVVRIAALLRLLSFVGSEALGTIFTNMGDGGHG